jgi:L-ribulose-5-phosphate 3-epimerase
MKEFSKEGTDFSLTAFRPLLDGTVDWPAVMEAFDKAGYKGWLTLEYFKPWRYYPEALVHQTSAMDRILGRG